MPSTMAALKVSYVSNVAGRVMDGAQVLAMGTLIGTPPKSWWMKSNFGRLATQA